MTEDATAESGWHSMCRKRIDRLESNNSAQRVIPDADLVALLVCKENLEKRCQQCQDACE
jgi:hypothetical protein